MRRTLRILAIVLVALLAVIGIGIYVVGGTDFGRERARRLALGVLEDKVNGTVRIGRLEGNLLRGIRIHDISITDSAGEPFIVADEIRTRYGLFSLAGKKILLRDLTLVRPVIVLDRKPGGDWNFDRIFAQAPDTTPRDTTAGWGDWIAFRDVTIQQGRLIVRTPWRPDASLTPAQQDSAVARTLAGESRTRVQRVAGGFQKVMTFDRIDAKLPTVRLADPDEESRLIRFASLQTVAAPFAPPVIDIRDVQGTFEFTGDSLWWKGARVRMPGSRIAGDGRYVYETSDMALRLKGEQLATADLRWLYPRLPSNGGGSLDFAMDWEGDVQRYLARNADVRIGRSRAQGTFGITLGDTLAIHDTDLRLASLETQLIEQLVPGLTLPRRGALSGRFAASGGLQAMQVDGDLAFADDRAGTSRAVFAGEVGRAAGGGVRAENLRVRAEPVQMALVTAFVPGLPIDGIVRGTATIDGTTATRLVAVADLTHSDRDAVSRLSGRGAIRLAGGTWLDVDVQARPLSLTTVGRFVPALGLQGSATGPVRLTGTLGNLRLDSRFRFEDGGALDLEGRLDLASAQKGYDIAAAMRLFNAHLVIASAPRTSLTARASARGRGFDPATMTMTARADVEASEYDSLAIDSAGVRMSIANGMLHADRIQLSGSRAVVTATGTFGLARGRTGELVFRGQADSLHRFARWLPRDTGMVAPRPARVAQAMRQAREDSLRMAEETAVERAVTGAPMPTVPVDTPPKVRRDSISGRVQVAGSIRGGLSRFDARARLAAEGLAVGGNTASAARGELAWTGAMTPQSRFAAAVQLDAAAMSGFALDSVDLRATYARRSGTASVAVWQDHVREYSVAGDYVLHLDHSEVHLGALRLRFDTSTWAATRPAAIRWGARGIEIADLEVRDGANGRIYVDGLLPSEASGGRASLRFAIDNFAVENIAGLLQSDIDLAGNVSINGAAQGTMRSPRFRIALGVTRGRYLGTTVPELHGTMTYGDRSLVTRMVASREGGQPMATLDGRLPINLSLAMAEGEQRVGSGALNIDLVADSLPLELIPKFTDAVADVHGRAAGKVVVRGTMRDPVIAGALALDRGHVRIVSTGMSMRNIAGYIRMRDDTVFVDSIAGRAGGPVRLAGTIGLPTLTNPVFDLRFFAQNARVLDNERGRLRADAEITMAGPFANTYISGRARVRSGVIYLPESDGKSVISAGDPALFNVVDTAVVSDREVLPTQSPLLAGLRMDVTLHVSRNTWVRSQEANVEIYTADEGLSLHVDRAKQTLALEGVVSTDNGQYTFLTKRFEIRRGSAMFIGATGPAGEALNPTLQLTGEYEVRQTSRPALNIRVVIGGTLERPKLSLESDAQPPIPQSDLLSYLAFGRSSSSLLEEGGGGTAGGTAGGSLVGQSATFAYKRLASVAVGVMADELEGDVSRSIGADILNITPADLPQEIYTPQGIGALLRGTEIEVGKYIDSRTFVALQARGTGRPGIRAARRTSKGFIYEASFEPRYPVQEPTLESPELPKAKGVLGLFLIREWRF